MSDLSAHLPPAAALLRHTVADFDTWKAAFDVHEGARREAGILGHHINRGEENPNEIALYMALTDVDRAKAFATSDDLSETMREAGVLGPPETLWVTPAREAIVWDRELPAVMISHNVADFDVWLAGYDEAEELRTSRGIIGQAANRGIDDPTLALVYHQAESFDALRSFMAAPELAAAMKALGVTSAPEATYHTGGWAKQYD